MEHYTRVTLEDIANRIGISRTTIYKVINNKGGVSKKTEEKVMEALESFGYRPNQAAKTLALNRVLPVGVIGFHSDRSPQFSANILKGFKSAEEELHDYGLHLDIDISDYSEPWKQIEAIDRMEEKGVQGFLIVPNDIGRPSIMGKLKERIDKLTARGKFVVTVNRDVPGSRRQWYVGCDYVKSGHLAAEILGKMTPPGRILVTVAGDLEDPFIDAEQRLEGFYKKMKEFPSLEISKPFYEGMNKADLYTYVSGELTKGDVTGIFDHTFELDHISKAIKDKKSPVKLIGFDLSRSIKQNMLEHLIDAVVFQDMFAQGYQAVKSLYAVLAGNNYPAGNIITKLEVVYEENLSYYI